MRGRWEGRGEGDGREGEREMGGKGRGRWEGRGEGDGREGEREMGGKGRGRWEGRGEGDGREGEREMGGKGRGRWEGRGGERGGRGGGMGGKGRGEGGIQHMAPCTTLLAKELNQVLPHSFLPLPQLLPPICFLPRIVSCAAALVIEYPPVCVALQLYAPPSPMVTLEMARILSVWAKVTLDEGDMATPSLNHDIVGTGLFGSNTCMRVVHVQVFCAPCMCVCVCVCDAYVFVVRVSTECVSACQCVQAARRAIQLRRFLSVYRCALSFSDKSFALCIHVTTCNQPVRFFFPNTTPLNTYVPTAKQSNMTIAPTNAVWFRGVKTNSALYTLLVGAV